MKITIMHSEHVGDILEAYAVVKAFIADNYHRDGNHKIQRKCILYGETRTKAVWGDLKHIRVSFALSDQVSGIVRFV